MNSSRQKQFVWLSIVVLLVLSVSFGGQSADARRRKKKSHPPPSTPALATRWKNTWRSSLPSVWKPIQIQNIPFGSTMDEGLDRAMQEQKPLFAYLMKPACPHCAVTEKKIFGEPMVRDFLSSNFVCTRIAAGSKDAEIIKKYMGCNAFPSFLIFQKSGKLVAKWYGQPKSDEDFLDKLHSILYAARK
jgi:thioredoxin-related protein